VVKEASNNTKEHKMAKNTVKKTPAGVKAAELRTQISELNSKLEAITSPPSPTDGLKLDLGCSVNKKEGFIGVDFEQRLNKDGKKCVDVIHDLTKFPWPWKTGSVQEVNCSHVLEHIPADKRYGFFNELYRIMKPGAKAFIATPHWCSNRAYGDLTHVWPPVSEMFYFYINREWRKINAPHLDVDSRPKGAKNVFKCDFDTTWGYSLAPWMQGRNEEWKANAISQFKEAAQDLLATVIRK
jgi:SAM-dependent methyltransferase